MSYLYISHVNNCNSKSKINIFNIYMTQTMKSKVCIKSIHFTKVFSKFGLKSYIGEHKIIFLFLT